MCSGGTPGVKAGWRLQECHRHKAGIEAGEEAQPPPSRFLGGQRWGSPVLCSQLCSLPPGQPLLHSRTEAMSAPSSSAAPRAGRRHHQSLRESWEESCYGVEGDVGPGCCRPGEGVLRGCSGRW